MRILVTVDLEPASGALLRYAVGLASRVGAELTMLHVYTSEAAMAALREAGLFLDLYVGRLRSELSYLLIQAGGAGRRDRIEVIEGHPVEAIVARARQLPADLIIMGTHQRRGLSRLLMGSVAEGVLRRAPCPVILAPDQMVVERPRPVAVATAGAR
jgi:nucleotide-binding universal stress UspA family protein